MAFTLGLIINPIAGIGGSVALKGSDGASTLKKARQLGGVSHAQDRARIALQQIESLKNNLHIITAANEMGADLATEMGFQLEVVADNQAGQTQPEDTENAVAKIVEKRVDCLLFVGGDGTARNIYNALHTLKCDTQLPVIGVPAGCKIHSAVYAVTPKHAGELLQLMVSGRPLSLHEAQVMDIDEDAFRQNIVKARPYGELMVAAESRYMQNMKEGGVTHETLVLQDIAAYVIEEMQDETLYFIGSGTTPKAILDELHLDATLLGVDAVVNQQLLASDLTEQQILSLLDEYPQSKLVITLIGGQGHVFGRGNQQLSARVIRQIGRENILLLATPEKIHGLQGRPLIVDTGDENLNNKLGGMMPVITGYDERILYRIT